MGPELVARYRRRRPRRATTRPRPGRRGRRRPGPAASASTSRPDVRIVTGFVEPHFFAGFSGGPKAVCPGLAATETILEAHSPRRIADAAGHLRHPRRATRCTTSSGPPPRWPRRTSRSTSPSTARRRVTAVFAGPLPEAHDAACAHVQRSAVQQVDGPFDLVVSTNGGHPLDRNLYQAVKGMAAAERMVPPGGIIVMAAACGDGVPAGGAFARILAGARSLGRPRRRFGPSGTGPLAGPGARPGARAGPRSTCTPTASPTAPFRTALIRPAPDLDGAVAAGARTPRAAGRALCRDAPRARLTVATVARDRRRAASLRLTTVSGIESAPGGRRAAVRLRRPGGAAARGRGAGARTPTSWRTSTSCPGTGEGKPPPLIGILQRYGYAPLVLLTAAASCREPSATASRLIGKNLEHLVPHVQRRASARWPSWPRSPSCCGPCRWRCGPTGAAARWWPGVALLGLRRLRRPDGALAQRVGLRLPVPGRVGGHRA